MIQHRPSACAPSVRVEKVALLHGTGGLWFKTRPGECCYLSTLFSSLPIGNYRHVVSRLDHNS